MIVVVLSNLFNLSCVRPVACSLWEGNSTRSNFNVDSESDNVKYHWDGLCSRERAMECMCSFKSWMLDGVLLCG